MLRVESENMPAIENMDFDRRFSGTARLYGDSALRRFAAAHVCVIGIGGVGSWAAEALARSAVGKITLIDLDHIAESNINRQVHALDSQLGRSKAEAMGARIQAINPACRVLPVDAFIEADNLDELINDGFDYVVDCIDSYRAKAALIAHCRRRKIKLITVGGAGGQRNPLNIRITDLSRSEQDPLLSKTRKLLRRAYRFPRNPKRRFDLPCVYSIEQQRPPAADAANCSVEASGPLSGLNCAGFGSSMAVTASFGLAAVAFLLDRLAKATDEPRCS